MTDKNTPEQQSYPCECNWGCKGAWSLPENRFCRWSNPSKAVDMDNEARTVSSKNQTPDPAQDAWERWHVGTPFMISNESTAWKSGYRSALKDQSRNAVETKSPQSGVCIWSAEKDSSRRWLGPSCDSLVDHEDPRIVRGWRHCPYCGGEIIASGENGRPDV